MLHIFGERTTLLLTTFLRLAYAVSVNYRNLPFLIEQQECNTEIKTYIDKLIAYTVGGKPYYVTSQHLTQDRLFHK